VASLSVEPLPPDQAIPKMIPRGERGPGGPSPMQMITPDRGNSTRLIIYSYLVNVSDVAVVTPGAKPWESEVTFTIEFTSLGFGGGVEVDDPKNPQKVKVEG